MPKVSFAVVSTSQGVFIVNRYDEYQRELSAEEGGGTLRFGVGYELMEHGVYEGSELAFMIPLMGVLRDLRKVDTRGGPLAVVDVGANMGTHTVAMGIVIREYGVITAIEPQRIPFMQLCAAILLNNLTDVVLAVNAALGDESDTIAVPDLKTGTKTSFGSLELTRAFGQDIGQDLSAVPTRDVPLMTLDSMHLPHCDFLKIDVEAMELEVLRGAKETIEKHRPVIMIEFLKVDQSAMYEIIKEYGYDFKLLGFNWLCTHKDDPINQYLIDKKPDAAP